MTTPSGHRNLGAMAGLASAALFGAGTPVAKLLLGEVGPWLLAGVLYTASGIALSCWRPGGYPARDGEEGAGRAGRRP
jgi:drug/metabolite transporter (DMT)-like permease